MRQLRRGDTIYMGPGRGTTTVVHVEDGWAFLGRGRYFAVSTMEHMGGASWRYRPAERKLPRSLGMGEGGPVDLSVNGEPGPDVRAMAVDVLADWIDGYFTPDDGPQLRVRVHDVTEDSVTVGVEECDPYAGGIRTFRIRVTAEETQQ